LKTDSWTSRIWPWSAFIGAVSVVTCAVVPSRSRGTVSIAVAALAVIAVSVTTCRRVRDPWPWRLFAVAGAFFIVGNTAQAIWAGGSRGSRQTPSAVDPLFLVAYSGLLVGGVLLVRHRSSGAEEDNLVDALIVATVVGVFLWAWVLVPTMQGSDLSTSEHLLNAAYSVFDLALIACASRLAVGSGFRVPSYYLLASSLGAMLAEDVTTSLQTAGLARDVPVAVISCLAFVLFALAGLHPSVGKLTEPPAAREVG
jgi:energy-coupling factor transporter transmembrane protein EcfT